MGLDEIRVMGTEAVEVLDIDQTPEGYYLYLCIGKVVIVKDIVLGEEQGKGFCHIINRGDIIEFPVVKNPGYVTFSQKQPFYGRACTL